MHPGHLECSELLDKKKIQLRAEYPKYPIVIELCRSGLMWWTDFAKLSINKYIVKPMREWKWTDCNLDFHCPSSSSSCPEPQALQSSKERGPFCHGKEQAEHEGVPGYYTTNSYQYEDTEL